MRWVPTAYLPKNAEIVKNRNDEALPKREEDLKKKNDKWAGLWVFSVQIKGNKLTSCCAG